MKDFLSFENSLPKDDVAAYLEILNEQRPLFGSLESENAYLQAVVHEINDREVNLHY